MDHRRGPWASLGRPWGSLGCLWEARGAPRGGPGEHRQGISVFSELLGGVRGAPGVILVV